MQKVSLKTTLLFSQGVVALITAMILVGNLFFGYMNADFGLIILFIPFLLIFYVAIRVQYALYKNLWLGQEMGATARKTHKVLSVGAGIALGFTLTYLKNSTFWGPSDGLFNSDLILGSILGILLFIPHMRLSSVNQ